MLFTEEKKLSYQEFNIQYTQNTAYIFTFQYFNVTPSCFLFNRQNKKNSFQYIFCQSSDNALTQINLTTPYEHAGMDTKQISLFLEVFIFRFISFGSSIFQFVPTPQPFSHPNIQSVSEYKENLYFDQTYNMIHINKIKNNFIKKPKINNFINFFFKMQ